MCVCIYVNTYVLCVYICLLTYIHKYTCTKTYITSSVNNSRSNSGVSLYVCMCIHVMWMYGRVLGVYIMHTCKKTVAVVGDGEIYL